MSKVTFSSEPGADVVAYLGVPHRGVGPFPAMICLQGHSTGMHHSLGVERDEITPMGPFGDRDFLIQCLRRGVAGLAIEQRSFGERGEAIRTRVSHHNPCHDAAMRALLLGRTLLGERVYDVDRGLDFLATRPEINARAIGVMGNSGGGTVAIHAAAVLSRLRFAMPSCSFCEIGASIFAMYHCADNYVPGLALDADSAEILGLFAPRPVVIVAGRDDELFPLASTKRAFAALQRIYAAAGAPDECRLVVGEGGHRFYADLAFEAADDIFGWTHHADPR